MYTVNTADFPDDPLRVATRRVFSYLTIHVKMLIFQIQSFYRIVEASNNSIAGNYYVVRNLDIPGRKSMIGFKRSALPRLLLTIIFTMIVCAHLAAAQTFGYASAVYQHEIPTTEDSLGSTIFQGGPGLIFAATSEGNMGAAFTLGLGAEFRRYLFVPRRGMFAGLNADVITHWGLDDYAGSSWAFLTIGATIGFRIPLTGAPDLEPVLKAGIVLTHESLPGIGYIGVRFVFF